MHGSLSAAFQFGSRYVGVATKTRRTTIRSLLDGEELAAFNSKEVTAACAVGQAIVCAAWDGRVYVIRRQEVEKLAHTEHHIRVWSAVALDHRRCLLGGDYGHLIELDLETREFTYTHFPKFDIPKPGRDIRCLVARANGVLVLGDKELVVQFENGKPTSLHARPMFSEIDFRQGVLVGDVLWMVASDVGPSNNLIVEFALADKSIRYHRIRVSNMRVPVIANIGGRLVLENEKAYRGFPGTLVTVKEFEVSWLLPQSVW